MNSSTAEQKKILFRPLHDKILVRRQATENKVGSFYVPDQAVEAPQQGEVLAVGPGKIVKDELIPLHVKEGDLILFGKYSGNELQVGSETLLILREDEVFGVLLN